MCHAFTPEAAYTFETREHAQYDFSGPAWVLYVGLITGSTSLNAQNNKWKKANHGATPNANSSRLMVVAVEMPMTVFAGVVLVLCAVDRTRVLLLLKSYTGRAPSLAPPVSNFINFNRGVDATRGS